MVEAFPFLQGEHARCQIRQQAFILRFRRLVLRIVQTQSDESPYKLCAVVTTDEYEQRVPAPGIEL